MVMERIRLLLKLLLLLALGGLVVWRGAFVEPERLCVVHVEAELAGWPADAAPVRVALLGDIHAAQWDAQRLDRIVQTTLAEKPEAVFLLGDFCFTTGKHRFGMPTAEVAERLAPLAEHCQVYYVMGNHDGFLELRDLGKHLRAAGFVPLRAHRDTVHVFTNGQGVRLRGTPFVPEKADASRLRPYFNPGRGGKPGRPLITVSHNPYHFLKWKLAGDLILCGHTHGGQICLPGMIPFIPTPYMPPSWQQGGWHRAASGAPLYITRGLGMTKLPLRLSCPPEITILQLRGK